MTLEKVLSFLLPIALAVIASLPGIMALRVQRTKDRLLEERQAIEKDNSHVDNAGKVADSAIELMDVLSAKVDKLEKQLYDTKQTLMYTNEKLAATNNKLAEMTQIVNTQSAQLFVFTEGIKLLTCQLLELEVQPVWTPPVT